MYPPRELFLSILSVLWPAKRWLGAGAITVLLTGCGTQPGIEILSQPEHQIAGSKFLLGDEKLSPVTLAVLQREGLSRKQVRADPDAVVRHLVQGLEDQAETRLAAAEIALEMAAINYRAGSGEVAGYALTALELSQGGLGAFDSPVHDELLELYNEASADLAWYLHQQNLGNRSIQARGPVRTYRVAWSKARNERNLAGFYDSLHRANRLKVRGFDDDVERAGIGGCVVGHREPTPEHRAEDPFMPPHSGYAVPLTAVVKFGAGSRVEVDLIDPTDHQTVMLDGKKYTLAGDFTAAAATTINAAPSSKTGFGGMIRPDKQEGFMGLYCTEPFRDDRIPLILVHGLMSTPQTWREVVNLVYSDPELQRNYQVLVFFYPTGYSIPNNAATLRERLKALQETYDPGRRNPKMREMVVVGHSMGCNLTTFQIRDGGDSLWRKFANKDIDELGISEEERKTLHRRMDFKANPDIDRVVFLCGPHRGSPLSNSWLGRFGAKLIRAPFIVASSLTVNLGDDLTSLGQSVIDEPLSSINSLKAHSPILEGILEQPMPYRPTIHSIIGDRGKGGGGKGGGVESSDGVVPYWSSHLDGVATEQIIPASHTSATNHPENVRALRAILYTHLG